MEVDQGEMIVANTGSVDVNATENDTTSAETGIGVRTTTREAIGPQVPPHDDLRLHGLVHLIHTLNDLVLHLCPGLGLHRLPTRPSQILRRRVYLRRRRIL